MESLEEIYARLEKEAKESGFDWMSAAKFESLRYKGEDYTRGGPNFTDTGKMRL